MSETPNGITQVINFNISPGNLFYSETMNFCSCSTTGSDIISAHHKQIAQRQKKSFGREMTLSLKAFWGIGEVLQDYLIHNSIVAE